jgi:CDGSH-type Zn-finger protein
MQEELHRDAQIALYRCADSNERAVPFGDGVSDQIGDGAGFVHEAVDAKQKDETSHRDCVNG